MPNNQEILRAFERCTEESFRMDDGFVVGQFRQPPGELVGHLFDATLTYDGSTFTIRVAWNKPYWNAFLYGRKTPEATLHTRMLAYAIEKRSLEEVVFDLANTFRQIAWGISY